MPLVAAIDVGTGSARAGIFDATGRLLGRAEQPIDTHAPRPGPRRAGLHPDLARRRRRVRAARAEAAARPEASPASRSTRPARSSSATPTAARSPSPRPATTAGTPCSGSTTARSPRPRLHRHRRPGPRLRRRRHVARDAAPQADVAEAPPPRLLVPRRPRLRSRRLSRLGRDGTTARSQCTLACKWSYLADEPAGWPRLPRRSASTISSTAAVCPRPRPRRQRPRPSRPAAAAGFRPHPRAASRPAWSTPTPAPSASWPPRCAADLDHQLALIAGTSSSVMVLVRNPRPIPGIGPLLRRRSPWSLAQRGRPVRRGRVLDHLHRLHGDAPTPTVMSRRRPHRRAPRREPDLAPRLHVLPDFHGSRSPP